MVKKALSLTTAGVMLYVYLLSLLRSDDALFLIASDSWVLNAFMVALASAVVLLSFQNKIRHWQLFLACTAGAVVFGFVGMAGLVYPSLDYYFGDLIKPLNYLFMLQAGINLGICSLSVRHQPVKLRTPAYKLWPLQLAQLRNRLLTSLKSVSAPERKSARSGARPA